MAVELERLIKKVSDYDIKLEAGKGGLHNAVSWVHMVETSEATTFLDGGEIAFVTGIGTSGEDDLLTLVKSIYNNNASGVILNIGPFIDRIPESIIEFGNENNFPIFSVPWKIHLAEIIRIFSYTISKDDQHNLAIASAFKNAILFPKQEELYVVPLSQNGFLPNWNYQVLAIAITSVKSTVFTSKADNLCLSLESYLAHNGNKLFAVFVNDNRLIVILADHNESETKSLVADVKSFFKTTLYKNEAVIMGLGRSTKSIRCLYKSYNQALAIERLHIKGRIDPDLISYSDMGVYRLLIGIDDHDIITDYYNNIIKPLEDYDNTNNSDLCTVLRCYLNHNGSVKDTADELFVHRNTINYKLSKAAEILDVDLSSLEARVELSLGFMLQDMI